MKLGVMGWANRLTRFAVFGLFASLALSRSLFTLFAVLALLAWLFVGNYRERVSLIVRNPATFLAAVLVLWMFVTALWSDPAGQTTSALNVYWKLLLIPIVVSTMTRPDDVNRCWQFFAAGIVVLLAHVYGLFWYTPSWVGDTAQPASVFFNRLPQAVALAIFSGWCLHQLLERHTSAIRRSWLVLGFLAASGAVLLISPQRLGYLSWGVMVLFAVGIRFPRSWRLTGLGLALLTLVFIFSLNPVVRDRVLLGLSEWQQYDGSTNYSSIGSRRYMWATTWGLIQEHPLWGYGTGSYGALVERKFADAQMCAVGCIHPHNQFLLIWLEQGIFGLATFVGMLISIAGYHLRRLSFHFIAMPVLIVFLMSCMVDSPLWYRGFVYLFVPILGLISIRRGHVNAKDG